MTEDRKTLEAIRDAKVPERFGALDLLLADTSHITRFEVIGDGRELVRHAVHVELSVQDEGRTLKVFLKPRSGVATT